MSTLSITDPVRMLVSLLAVLSGCGGLAALAWLYGQWTLRRAGRVESPVPPMVVDPVDLSGLTAAELARVDDDHGAESFALHPEIFREDEGEEFRRKLWRANFDWYLSMINERFAEVIGDEVFPVSPAGPPGTILDFLPVEVDPTVILSVIEEENDQPAWFSWHTDHHPTIRTARTVLADRLHVVGERP